MTPIAFLRHRLVRIYQSYFPRELTATEHQFIRKNLTEELTALYYSQPLCDQRHGLLVFEKCQQLFITDAPTEYELLCASIFHDLAKKDCRFSVTQRIFFATMLSVFPYRRRESFANSNVRIFRRISIYDNHSSLSWEMVSPMFRATSCVMQRCIITPAISVPISVLSRHRTSSFLSRQIPSNGCHSERSEESQILRSAQDDLR